MLTNAHNHIAPNAPASGNANDRDYQDFLGRLHKRFAEAAKAGPLFTTDIDLWPMYLNSFPEHERKHHDCNACRRIVQTMIPKRLFAIPPLAAVFVGSCRNPEITRASTERDVRAAVCAFAFAVGALIVASLSEGA